MVKTTAKWEDLTKNGEIERTVVLIPPKAYPMCVEDGTMEPAHLIAPCFDKLGQREGEGKTAGRWQGRILCYCLINEWQNAKGVGWRLTWTILVETPFAGRLEVCHYDQV